MVPSFLIDLIEVNSIAKQISEKSPLSIRGVKKTVQYTRDHSVEDSLNQVKLWNSAHLYSNDLLIAMQAGMQRKKPNFDNLR